MESETLVAWRTREGTALLLAYGLVIAAVWTALQVLPATARAYAGAPLWLRILPVAVPLFAALLVALVPTVRAHAHRLQLISVGAFLLALVAVFLDKPNGSVWLLLVVIGMFGVQYAFMRWQELVAAYAGTLAVFALVATTQHIATSAAIMQFQALTAVALVCILISSLRLRSFYTAANERFKLERQTAELRRQTEQNARMAFTDQLTGLLNRAGMNDLIDRALLLRHRRDGVTALLYVDLDGFKQINDVCGHDAGDRVLVEAALRIQYQLRAGETAGRIGGDEFVVLMPSVETLEEPRALAARLEESFEDPFYVDHRAFRISASIGMAWSCEHGATRSELLSAADKAMYVVKRWRYAERPTERIHDAS